MYNAGKIVPGLVFFLVLATAPIWYNVASGHEAAAPEIEKPQGETIDYEELIKRWSDAG